MCVYNVYIYIYIYYACAHFTGKYNAINYYGVDIELVQLARLGSIEISDEKLLH